MGFIIGLPFYDNYFSPFFEEQLNIRLTLFLEYFSWLRLQRLVWGMEENDAQKNDGRYYDISSFY